MCSQTSMDIANSQLVHSVNVFLCLPILYAGDSFSRRSTSAMLPDPTAVDPLHCTRSLRMKSGIRGDFRHLNNVA